MIPVNHPLKQVRTELEELAAAADQRRLATLLHGEGLPLLGGHEERAELIHEALKLQPYRPELVLGLASLLGTVLEEHAKLLANGGIDRTNTTDLKNTLLLAELLPRSEAVFQGVIGVHEALPGIAAKLDQSKDPQRIGVRLREALRWQQSDDRLLPFWLGLLDSQSQVDLLNGFKGLLWLPPEVAEEDHQTVARLERGLRKFAVGAVKTKETEALLGWAIRTLDEAYPRSSSFWQQFLAPLSAGWPAQLKRTFQKRWPTVKLPTGKQHKSIPAPLPRPNKTVTQPVVSVPWSGLLAKLELSARETINEIISRKGGAGQTISAADLAAAFERQRIKLISVVGAISNAVVEVTSKSDAEPGAVNPKRLLRRRRRSHPD